MYVYANVCQYAAWHSLEELALATGRVPHDTHVDVSTEMSALHGRLGHTPKQHQ